MAAALEEGVAEPDDVLTVTRHIEAGDRTVNDAHDHAPIPWTVTGILAKSSNVGTIMPPARSATRSSSTTCGPSASAAAPASSCPESRPASCSRRPTGTARAANVPIGRASR